MLANRLGTDDLHASPMKQKHKGEDAKPSAMLRICVVVCGTASKRLSCRATAARLGKRELKKHSLR